MNIGFKCWPILLLAAMLNWGAVASKAQQSRNLPKIEPGIPIELAQWRAARYSKIRYNVDLTIEKKSSVLKGTIEAHVTLKPASGQSYEKLIILDWRKITGAESSSTVSNVSINGKAVVPGTGFNVDAIGGGSGNLFYEHNDHLVFCDGVVPGENVVKLDFTSPIMTSGAAVTRINDEADGGEYIYSLFVPSDGSTALPLIDQPDLKATFQLDVTAPNTWEVLTNSDPLVVSAPATGGGQGEIARVGIGGNMNKPNLVTKILCTAVAFVVVGAAGVSIGAQKDSKTNAKKDTAAQEAEAKRQKDGRKKQKQAQGKQNAEAGKQQQADAAKAKQQRQAEGTGQQKVQRKQQQSQAEADAQRRPKQRKQDEALRQQQRKQQDKAVGQRQKRRKDDTVQQQSPAQQQASRTKPAGLRSDPKLQLKQKRQQEQQLKVRLQQQNHALYTRTLAQTTFERRYVRQLAPSGSYLSFTRTQQQQIQRHRWNLYNNYWQHWQHAHDLRQRLLEQQRRHQFSRYMERYWDRLREDRRRLERAQYYDNLVNNYYYYRDGEYYYTSEYGAQMLRDAVNNGYEEGFYAGQADRSDGWEYDPTRSYAYEDASFGYDNYYVSIDEYGYYFRQGFERGYDDGFDGRNQYGRLNNGRYTVLGELIATIIDAIRY